RAPLPGEVFRFPEQAQTLRLIGESNGEAFYRGEIGERIVRHAEATGGYLSLEDLASHHAEWVDPIRVTYRGFDVWEIPPNGQGIVALLALGMLEGFDMPSLYRASAEELHLVIESLKLAFADAYACVADPAAVDVPTAALLDEDYIATRRQIIRPQEATAEPVPGRPGKPGSPRDAGKPSAPGEPGDRHAFRRPLDGDTVYLCTADASGMMVSFIQSNYMGFGSGIVVPETGISLQNRGYGFTLEQGHPNCLAPGKRPYHTIIPGFITQGGTALAAFGVMGGDMQPQGHVQVVLGLIDHALNPQAAIDAPRVRVLKGREVAAEPAISPEVVSELARRGHQVKVVGEAAGFGGGQMIWRDPETGVFICGSEPRKDGMAVAW
ncbi:MAG: gamma-glutamyltransferase, partial [Bacillota bacterium]